MDTSWSFGLVVPLTINDNTYGANSASDWAPKVHTFDQLLGSDKWEVTLPVIDGTDVVLTLDYIASVGGDESNAFDAQIEEKGKKGEEDKKRKKNKKGKKGKKGKSEAEYTDRGLNDLVVVETSLSYNFEKLGLSSADLARVFGKSKDSPSVSGDYDFDAPYERWLPEIMYEFSIEKVAFDGKVLDLVALAETLGVVHMSPNKLGGNKIYAFGDPIPFSSVPGPTALPISSVPEPGTLALFGIGLVGLGFMRRRKAA